MLGITFVLSFFIGLLLPIVASSSAHLAGAVVRRQDELLPEYDYIVVGGGLSGLVVANRLTENSQTTVLVIEAGDLCFYVPGEIGTPLGTSYDWQVPTVPQDVLVNGNITIPLGKVVGGGSAVNGMLFDRASPKDYNAWAKLGNPGWDWKGLLPYFIKSETFMPPYEELLNDFHITWEPSVHGTEGPVHGSYPPFIYNQTKNFLRGMEQLGVNIAFDQAANAVGAFYLPSSLNPSTMTRSFTRPDYNNPAQKRHNYHIIANTYVTKILMKKLLLWDVAYGVEYATSSTSERYNVHAKKEVIIAAGAIHTPQLLQLSGIGDKELLQSLGVQIVKDLPGVGSNFQDHPSWTVPYTMNNLYFNPLNWTTNETLKEQYMNLYRKEKKGPYTVAAGNALAFVPVDSVSDRTDELVKSGKEQTETYLLDSVHESVSLGYKAQRSVLLDLWGSKNAATIEFSQGPTGELVIALEHELSRGDVRIASTDPFSPPTVNWRAMTNPLDLEVMIDAFLTGRKFMQTPAIQELQPVEGDSKDAVTREQILALLKQKMSPSFSHVSCTCPMMPLALGGVVSPELRVYGIPNLRIVDASVIPMITASHLQATVYALAEKAADIIKKST